MQPDIGLTAAGLRVNMLDVLAKGFYGVNYTDQHQLDPLITAGYWGFQHVLGFLCKWSFINDRLLSSPLCS